LANGKYIRVTNNKDIEWKIIYIGSAEDNKYDQVLDSVLIGPLQIGQMKFTLDVYYSIY
jgi:hypothetical protein